MSDERLPSSEPTPPPESPMGGLPGDFPQLGLSSQQLALFRALSSVGESLIGERLGACYLGALKSFA